MQRTALRAAAGAERWADLTASKFVQEEAMRQESLEQIGPLLAVLRANLALVEVRPTMFHLDGRDFVHFHEEPGGVVADVLLTTGRVHMPVSSGAEQAELLDRIGECLSSLDSRARDRQRRGQRRRRP